MYQHIMVPMDGSELAECVLPHVEAIAGGCHVPEVTLVHVLPHLHLYDYAEQRLMPDERQKLTSQATDSARKYLKTKVAELKRKGIAAGYTLLSGEPIKQLVSYAEEKGIDLIIISTHGRSGISQIVWGSVAESLLRTACVPVLMIRAPGCVPGIKA